ncbi:glycosyl hydrolase [Hymenobacter sp. BT18]|uniref:glycoside hydrolase family 3 N-terminal domain-containing protein n=1 Tax=Hymenobacter sp. BT18 TaxID=2835648 RepID=UPI00143E7B6A|nr:glycoside hydrolase family 3 N-terminal domain-containing protein [Hymenobacter sp. BT18]QIX60062.1 glycosyl hydrolase [Hymenobacter sp. BT18]
MRRPFCKAVATATVGACLVVGSTTPLLAQRKTLEQKVDSVLQLMTLEEKAGQLNQYTGDAVTGPAVNDPTKLEQIRSGRVGSMLNIRGAQRTRELQAEALKSRLKIPLLFGLDVIHGYQTTFPIPLGEAASWDMTAIRQSAHIAAVEAAAAGQHWTFAPMVDIARDPRWGRVMEGAGEDPYLGSQIARARVLGFQGEKIGATDAVLACAKHFAGYGAAQAGRDYHTVDMSRRLLWEVYLPPFKAALDAGAATFMNAFNELDGIPSTGNRYLQRDILKGQWKFQGFVVSDWGSIGEMVNHGFAKDNADAGRLALLAGSDMDMESRSYVNSLPALVKSGQVPEELVNDAVRRILRKKFELGLFQNPNRFSDVAREKKLVGAPEHRQIARDVARKSIVLLKNEGNVLPLDKKTKRIALIGPLGTSKLNHAGFWAVNYDSTGYVSVLEGLQNKFGKQANIQYARGCGIKGESQAGFAEAVKTAQDADVVVMAVGEAYDMSGEAKSRTDIGLPGQQEALIKAVVATGKPVVVLMMAGRPLTFNWTAEHAPAILYTWWLGSEAGNAIADVLTGDYNPAGKLPMTFPRSLGQVPIFYAAKNTGRPSSGDKDVLYKSAYIDQTNRPQYAFGHGLSYTKFTYGNLKLSTTQLGAGQSLTVSCTLTNAGKTAGEEVVQLYLRDLVASVTRPIMELKDFQKVQLKPGETKTLTFTITSDKLSFYNQDMQWTTEPGEFRLMLGSASDDIRLDSKFELLK